MNRRYRRRIQRAGAHEKAGVPPLADLAEMAHRDQLARWNAAIAPFSTGGVIAGRGGQATVYLARHPVLGSGFVCKIFSLDAGLHTLFGPHLNEALALQAASEAGGVPRVMHVGTLDDGRGFVIMTKLAGLPLRRVLEFESVSLQERKRIALFVAMRLQDLHSLEPALVHGDLKSENLAVDYDREAKRVRSVQLFDLGTAGLHTEKIVCTPESMPPELARQIPPRAAQDIYTWGRLVARLVLGDHDGTKADPDAVLAAADRFGAILAPAVARALSERSSDRPEAWELVMVCRRELGDERGFEAVTERIVACGGETAPARTIAAATRIAEPRNATLPVAVSALHRGGGDSGSTRAPDALLEVLSDAEANALVRQCLRGPAWFPILLCVGLVVLTVASLVVAGQRSTPASSAPTAAPTEPVKEGAVDSLASPDAPASPVHPPPAAAILRGVRDPGP